MKGGAVLMPDALERGSDKNEDNAFVNKGEACAVIGVGVLMGALVKDEALENDCKLIACPISSGRENGIADEVLVLAPP